MHVLVDKLQKKILVTGGAGFIGSHVVDLMLANGNIVAVLDNMETGEFHNLPKNFQETLIFKELSVTSKEAKSFIEEFQPHSVIHLAAQMNVRRSVEDPLFDAEQNILGIINVLEALKTTKVAHFIFSSTGGAIYGEQDSFPADESHAINPECPYGLSKRCAEMYIQYYSPNLVKNNSNFKATALRFGNVYGPRQNPKGEAGVVAIFSKRSITGENLLINGDGGQTRDFIFVADIVSAIELVVNDNSTKERGVFEVFNLGTGKETSINEVASELLKSCKECNLSDIPEIVYGPEALGEQRRSLLDASSFSQTYDWNPKVDISKGIELTFKSFQKN